MPVFNLKIECMYACMSLTPSLKARKDTGNLN